MAMTKFATYDDDYATLGQVKAIVTNDMTIMEGVVKTLPKTYSTQPQVPYHTGDTYTLDGKSYTCITTRTTGSFTQSDWIEAVPANKIIAYANASGETERISKTKLDADIITTQNLSAQTISCNQLSGGAINGQTITGCNINALNFLFGSNTSTGFLTMGNVTSHPWCSGLNVWGGNGIQFWNGTTIDGVGSPLGYILTDGNMTINSNGNILLRPNGWSYGFTFSSRDDVELTCNSSNAICFQDNQTKYTWGGGKLFYDYNGNGTDPTSTNDEVATTGSISGKAYKKDIIKLTAQEERDLSLFFSHIPVSKFTYKYGTKAGEEKIGFILEDIEKINNPYTKYFPIGCEMRYDTGNDLSIKKTAKTDKKVRALYYDTKDVVSMLVAGLSIAHKRINELEEKLNEK